MHNRGDRFHLLDVNIHFETLLQFDLLKGRIINVSRSTYIRIFLIADSNQTKRKTDTE